MIFFNHQVCIRTTETKRTHPGPQNIRTTRTIPVTALQRHRKWRLFKIDDRIQLADIERLRYLPMLQHEQDLDDARHSCSCLKMTDV